MNKSFINRHYTELKEYDYIYCIKCNLLLNNPYQDINGDRYCYDCCNYQLSYPDANIRRKIESITVKCANSNCQKHFSLSMLELHLKKCEYSKLCKCGNYIDPIEKTCINHQKDRVNSFEKQLMELKEFCDSHSNLNLISDVLCYRDKIDELHKSLLLISKRPSLPINYFIWRIENVQERLIKNKEIIHSDPILTKKYGYKLRMKIYIQHDHLALYYYIIKSDYDELLEWPFNQKVTVMLFSQSSKVKNKSITFKNGVGESFIKPVHEANIACGAPDFISLQKLRNDEYMKDDLLFMRIEV